MRKGSGKQRYAVRVQQVNHLMGPKRAYILAEQ